MLEVWEKSSSNPEESNMRMSYTRRYTTGKTKTNGGTRCRKAIVNVALLVIGELMLEIVGENT
jgi:hypothetical protein